MNLIGKKFQNKSGKVCIVKDINEKVTTFSDGTRVDTRFLLDKNYFVEIPTQQVQQNYKAPVEKIDPNSFFSQRNPLFEQINSIPNDFIEKLPTDNLMSHRYNNYPVDNSSAVVQYDPEREKEELARKYNVKSNAIVEDAREQANRQNSKFMSDPKLAKMLEEEGMNFNQMQQVQQAQVQITQPAVQQHVTPPDNYKEIYSPSSRQIDPVVETKNPSQYEYIDPIISMFRKAKRNTDFKISIDIEKKIPRLDFIEMMEDSYETSIIEYLAEEFTQQLLSNPNIIRDKIIKELQNMLDNNSDKPKKAKKKEEEISTENLLPEKKQRKNKDSEIAPGKELEKIVKELTENSTIDALLGISKDTEENKETND
jgi:hypothetical protein